jgi:hypothetical protein
MDVITAACNVAEDYVGASGKGARALAVDIDKNPVTLSHELNETGGAKLGLRTAVKMTRRSRDLRILNAFAQECGCMVLALPEALQLEGSAAMQDLGHTAKEFADVVAEVSARIADGEISENDLRAIEREWGELVAAGQGMVARLRAKRDADSAARLRAVPR